MKKGIYLSLMVILSGYTFIFSQDIQECGTFIPSGVTLQQAVSGDLVLYKRTTLTPPLRLALHIVTYSNGTEGIAQEILDQKLTALYDLMSQAYFQFYVFSKDTIKSDQYADINGIDEANALRTINVINDCINIYFVPIAPWNGISSFSSRIPYIGFENLEGIIIWNPAPLSTLPHEVGHYFDLFHTYEDYFNPRNINGNIIEWENIERTGSCSNWDYTGDLLEGTPSDPSGRVKFATINVTNCQFAPTGNLPPDGCNQTNYNPHTRNLMITEVKHCRTQFVDDQKDRMNQTLTDYRQNLLKHAVYLENRINTTNAGGTLKINTLNYNSGDYTFLSDGNYNIGTNNERFINFQSSTINYKHNNWNSINNDFYLIRNASVSSDGNQIGRFVDIRYSKIESRLEGQLILKSSKEIGLGTEIF